MNTQSEGYHFRFEHGTIYLYDGNEIQTGYRTLAFCFNSEEGSLHKYGELETVEQWSESRRKKYMAAGLAEFAENIVVVSAPEWDLHLINQFISNSGFIGRWWQKQTKALAADAEVADDNECLRMIT